jgi:hypothetical protein
MVVRFLCLSFGWPRSVVQVSNQGHEAFRSSAWASSSLKQPGSTTR